MVVPLSLTAILLSAAGYLWGGVYRDRPWWRYMLKPGTMGFIILLAGWGAWQHPGAFSWLILAGLMFSLAGDIWLMLPQDRFLRGLISFFMGHLCYVLAFLTEAKGGLVIGIPVTLFLILNAWVLLRPLARGAEREGGTLLLIAVIAYVFAISLMVLFAWMTKNPWSILGALLFYISDAILGWDRFVRRLSWRDYGIMIPYFAAQTLIALSVVLG
ncbi:lysoplasmalogenase [Desmospora profundinema]|uniref:Membrane protein YhhN n=1 Tax=Desmospora profundinema TaxID=1571184 RepID=A0ABU1IMS7_9BACL|nr:lysoplasmalogenase [Desmospora profundinema]MDR6226078.1 putative membrane protein YhhN [Desmospora profundinema]